MTKPRLLYAVTHPATAKHLLRGQLAFMQKNGFDVVVLSSPGPELELVREREGVSTVAVTMSRALHLREGPRAMTKMLAAVRAARPDVINASTPKAGLLGMLAARALKVRARVYLLRGLRLEGESGAFRSALGIPERVASACAHRVVCVSQSLRRVYVDGGYAPELKTTVIPSNGIDLSRFPPHAESRVAAARIRAELGISDGDIVAGFVGRLVADKGVADLIEGIERATLRVPQLKMLIVGGDLAGDALPKTLANALRADARFVFAGKVEDPAPYYAAMDLLVFPSYREGLPNVPLEAAACELPTVGYRSTGMMDAISHGVTGELVRRGDAGALGDALVRYASSPQLRRIHGAAARVRVRDQFTNERTWTAWLRLYEELLAAHKR